RRCKDRTAHRLSLPVVLNPAKRGRVLQLDRRLVGSRPRRTLDLHKSHIPVAALLGDPTKAHQCMSIVWSDFDDTLINRLCLLRVATRTQRIGVIEQSLRISWSGICQLTKMRQCG